MWTTRLKLAALTALFGSACLVHRPESVAGPDEIETQGELPSQPVTVHEDAWGIPHVEANSLVDAAYAIGVLHAEERLWQMDFTRRVGHGRLSEILGKRTIDADRFLRGRMLSRSAQAALDRLSPEERAPLEAYAAGVNDTIERMERPWEYKLLRLEPQPWKPLDSMVIVKVMALNLSGNVAAELSREAFIEKLGEKKANWFLTGYPSDGPRILPEEFWPPLEQPASKPSESDDPPPPAQPKPDGEAPEQVEAVAPKHAGRFSQGRQLAISLLKSVDGMASNSWVIAPSKTTTGTAILANDPHLGVNMPSIWYLLEVDTPELHALGTSLPGFPGIVIGHNEHIAWGMTTGALDPQDLFYEQIKDGKVRDGDDWVPLEVLKETIHVRRGKPVEMQLRVGPRGPILTEFFDAAKQDVSLRWIAHEPDDQSYQCFLSLLGAKNWDDFKHSLTMFGSPAHNFVYADTDGHIGWKVAGRVPMRAGRDGRVPARGWEPADQWQGFVSPADLPEAFDPKQGFIATANNHPVPDTWPRDLGYYADAPFRATRIVERLSAADDWDPEKVRALHMDVKSAQAQQLLPFLETLEPSDPAHAKAAALWKGWDGEIRADSAAAALYEVWLHQVTDVVARHHLGDELFANFGGVRGTFLRKVFTGEAAELCKQPGVPDCKAAGEIGVGRAVIYLSRTLGDDPAAWRWGDLHALHFHHQLGVTKGLQKKVDVRVPAPGDPFTVNVAGYRTRDYTQTWMPSYRQVVTPGKWNDSSWIYAPGQSGVWYREHYKDLVDDYMAGRAEPMLFGDAARKHAVRTRTIGRK
jgi:penicillin amidase